MGLHTIGLSTSEAARRVNVDRPLTHSSVATREQDGMNGTCNVDGCDRDIRVKVWGLCNAHYQRVKMYGRLEPLHHPSIEARLVAGSVERPNGCIEWTGPSRKGYGAISYEAKQWSTHRLAWTLANGPIPDGMFICHHCDNKPCWNVNHLFLGTVVDNAADMAIKGRGRKKQKECK